MIDLISRLESGRLDQTLSRLYGTDRLDGARSRCSRVLSGFTHTFGTAAQAIFSAPGRTELGGNHTDHQHGRVLAAGIDLDILAAVSPNSSGLLRFQSQGYSLITVDLSDLTPKSEERNTSAALIRGVAARMVELGCPLDRAGLDAYLISDVPGGSGLSSSATFEVLVGTILNHLFWGQNASPLQIAQIGQYAENVFFGKPCGLMDQTASALGGVVSIDFRDPAAPIAEQIPLDLTAQGHALCILDSGAGHDDLTGEYAAITQELKAVCRCFGKEFLRDVPEEAFLDQLPRIRREVGDRAVLRALHVYGENRRAAAQALALKQGDFQQFLNLVRESGRSSAMYLQNLVPAGQTTQQELLVTIALCEQLLDGRGAVRVHGGGFGGTAQAFVPLDMAATFKSGIERFLGRGSCHVVRIRPMGGVPIV